ncbi:MAG TPA: ECF transporter S component [Lachnospiraceae bacterium]|nr:ECF transporter S component [Lachnospiraceae bacterium]
MMRFKFNLSEFLIALVGTVLFVAFSFVKIPSFPSAGLFRIENIILAYFAMVYGPVVGGIIGGMGYSIASYLTNGASHWSLILSFAIFAIVIGQFRGKYKVSEGEFGVKQMLSFQMAQITANMITWVLIASLLEVLLYEQEVVYVIILGFTEFVYSSLLVGIFTTMLGWMHSSIITIRKKNIKLQNEK